MHIPHAFSFISLFFLIFAKAFNIPHRIDGSREAGHQSVLDDVGDGSGHGRGLVHSDKTEKKLQLSAVLNEPDPPYHAIVQCWELSPSFVSYPTTGRALSLGDTANTTYVVLPPRGGEGWHRPPSPMFFVLLSGLAHVKTYPPAPTMLTWQQEQRRQQHHHDQDQDDDCSSNNNTEPTESLYIVSGVNPLIIAVDTDTRSPGHLTFYPSDIESVALQVPFKNGKIPDHEVLYDGPCRR